MEYGRQLEIQKKRDFSNFIYRHKYEILNNMRNKLVNNKGDHMVKMCKWAKEDLYEKKYIIFPLNKEQHWSMIVVYNT